MILKRLLHASFFFFTFLLSSLAVVMLLSPHVYIAPAAGISECESFTNGTFDPSKCNVIPGSLLVIVLKSSPMFSYVSNEFMVYTLKEMTLYFLILFVALISAAVIYYYRRKYLISIASLASAVALALITLPLLAPYTTKDIVCYKAKSAIGDIIVCHTLERIEDGYVILKSSRYKIEERVPEDRVVGKVAIILNPPFGTIAYFTQFLYDVTSTLWEIFGKGNIPVGYRIYYFIEK